MLDRIAMDIWYEVRAGITPLDSERAIVLLSAALGRFKAQCDAQVLEAQQEAAKALKKATDQKNVSRKLVQLVRRSNDACPVCGVGDTQKHLTFCWLRSAHHPVWNKMTESEWNKTKKVEVAT